jgi:hypothetical protein
MGLVPCSEIILDMFCRGMRFSSSGFLSGPSLDHNGYNVDINVCLFNLFLFSCYSVLCSMYFD